ncbi:MAG: element excision factor XisH family protein [Blastocatellia bacterium]
MAAKDIYHDHVRKALEKDGWTITHDPLNVQWPGANRPLHPESERLIGAEKDGEEIAVEVVNFLGPSQLVDLQYALGEFGLYHYALQDGAPARKLFMAIREDVYFSIFKKPEMEMLRAQKNIRLLVFDRAGTAASAKAGQCRGKVDYSGGG